MDYFYGTHTVAIDSKKRIGIPAKIRASLPPGEDVKIYLARGVGKHISAFTEKEWGNFLSNLTNLYKISEKTRGIFLSTFIGSLDIVEPDKAGRFVLADHLVKYAQLFDCSEVLVIGAGDHFEIWNPQDHETSQPERDKQIDKSLSAMSLKNMAAAVNINQKDESS